MLYYLIMCRSITFAQRTARQLEHAGIRTMVIRAPYSLSADGCGYCVKISQYNFDRAAAVLRGTELMPRKIYQAIGRGRYEEVAEF